MSDTPVLNIWQRINAVDMALSEASWQKNAKNDTYSSVPIDLMRTEVSKAESEMGIVVHYDELEFGHMEHNGKQLCMIKARLTYINVDDPRDCAVFDRTGVAYDAVDKGWNKCESIIYKNLYKGLYHVGEREDDPDSISNNENDLLAVFRCEKFHDELSRFVQKHLPEVRKIEAEQKEAERQRIREAKRLASQSMLPNLNVGKPAETTPEQRQEQAVVEAMGDDAEFIDADAIAEAAKARRDAVDVGNARAMLAQLRRSDPQNEILTAYIERYGGLSQLKDPQVIDCFLDLQDAGVIQ